jgi:hypothetical protein
MSQCIYQRRNLPVHIKKNSVDKPVYKKETKEDANTYGPVTLVSALSKVLKN